MLLCLSAAADLFSIVFGLTSRILNAWDLDPANTQSWLCKGTIFIIFTTFKIALWLFMFATIDQWLTSSVQRHRHQWCTLKNIYRYVTGLAIGSMILDGQTLYCDEANQTETPLRCFGRSPLCRVVTEWTFAYIFVLIPMVGMLIFRTLTVLNVRRANLIIQPMIAPVTTSLYRRMTKIHHQLLIMLLMQNGLLIVFFLRVVGQTLYLSITRQLIKSLLRRAVENFLREMNILVDFALHGVSFYIYTVASENMFRKELVLLLTRAWKARWKMCPRRHLLRTLQ